MFERVMVVTITLVWVVMVLGIIGWLGYAFVSWMITGIMNLLFLV